MSLNKYNHMRNATHFSTRETVKCKITPKFIEIILTVVLVICDVMKTVVYSVVKMTDKVLDAIYQAEKNSQLVEVAGDWKAYLSTTRVQSCIEILRDSSD